MRFPISNNPDRNSFWGFYLGRPFRMNAGDVSVPKPASTLEPEKEGTWRPYGLQTTSKELEMGLNNPTELICRQFVVLWEMVSPAGHILLVKLLSGASAHLNGFLDTDVPTFLGMIYRGFVFK